MSKSLEEIQSFFTDGKDSGELSKRIQGQSYADQLAWEQVSVCIGSPGPVKDNEVLLRQIVSPVHFDLEANEVKPNLFEDVVTKGASTHRRDHSTEDRVLEIARDRVKLQNLNPPNTGFRTFIGHVSVPVAAVRRVSVDLESLRDIRVLAVYDTANSHDSSHADICLLRRHKQAELSVKSQLYLQAKGTLKRFE